MFKRTQICSAALLTMGSALLTTATQAQTTTPTERIEITGSSIKRISAEGSLIKRREMAVALAPLLEEYQTTYLAIARSVGIADEVAECEDGAEALARFAEFQPDLVLMDIKMPKTDGITASKQIIAAYPNANICIVTDYGDEKTRKLASQAGVANYVTKEHLFEIREIIERI